MPSNPSILLENGSYLLQESNCFINLEGVVSAYIWYVLEAGGGTIDAGGNYTAPSSAGTYHVVAVKRTDPTQVGVAEVIVS